MSKLLHIIARDKFMTDRGFDNEQNWPSVTSAIVYRDPKQMYRWLEDAFGFEPYGIILDREGKLMHSQMTFGSGAIMVGNEWSADHRSPASIGGANSQTIHVHLEEDIDGHCQRARAAGAEIIQDPENQFYGDRTYRARDPEGHIWTFGQTQKTVTPAEWDADLGVTTSKRLPE
jgi:uncharacterized glyoxalase superfamily protein PhnB